MTLQNKTSQKIISLLMIILVLAPTILLSAPKQANAFSLCPFLQDPSAVPANSGATSGATQISCATNIKQWAQKVLEIAAMQAAKKVLAKMTQSIVSWVNNGFHGSPLFLENPSAFFEDIAKSEIKNLVNEFGYDPNRFPFGKAWALNVIDSYKRQAADNEAYTLSKVMSAVDAANYRNNFNYGGWNGFLINTQYPQNNYLGFQMSATEELARRLQGVYQAPAQLVQTKLQQGMGFLSPQTCPTNDKYNNGYNEFNRPSFDEAGYRQEHPYDPGTDQGKTWTLAYAKEKAKWAETNECPGGLVSTTPGSVVAGQVTKALGAPQDSTTLAAAMGNDLKGAATTILAAVIDHFINKGLNSLGSSHSSPPPDNWSYDGQTLGGGGNTIPGALSIPSNVSIQLGSGSATNPSTTTISGGTAPYGITTDSDPAIATVKIVGNVLTIKGIKAGTTSTVIEDSSSPTEKVTVQITVVNAGDLLVVPANITIDKNETAEATVYGGEGEYSVSEPNRHVANVAFSSDTLVVVGMESGTTSVVIRDSSSPTPKTATVNITVLADLTTMPSTVSVASGSGHAPVIILGGKSPYKISEGSEETIATASIDGAVLNIAGVAVGTTSVTIEDSSTTPKDTTVNITVTVGGE